MFVRSAYNYASDVVSFDSGVTFPFSTRTQRHFKDEVDINFLVSQFITGRLPLENQVWPAPPVFDEIFDFQTAMNAVRAGQEAFDALPSTIRNRFSNNPQLYFEFVNNPDNLKESESLGLVPKGTHQRFFPQDYGPDPDVPRETSGDEEN